jgi:hypothetical protein
VKTGTNMKIGCETRVWTLVDNRGADGTVGPETQINRREL